MKVEITNVHLDLGAGRRGTDMGPSAIHVAGLVGELRAIGHSVESVVSFRPLSIETMGQDKTTARYLREIEDLCGTLADRVYDCCEQSHFPLVLGGDHAQAAGVVAGLSRHYKEKNQRIGLLWVDAHTDMNTPETSPTGNVHGMPLAALLGYGPAGLTSLSGDGPAVLPENVVIFGARDVDTTEVLLVKETNTRVYTMSEIDRRGTAVCIAEALQIVTSGTAGVHLSFDLDGVDPDFAPGVGTPVPGGLTLREALLVCEMAGDTGRLLGMEVVELNPTLDVANKTGRLAKWLIESALGRTII